MDVIASKPCFYKKHRSTGEQFSMPRNFARQYISAKLVKPAPETVARTYTPRTYTTRVMPRAATETVVLEADPFVFPDAETPPAPLASVSDAEGLKALRAEYTEALGKRPFFGWNADVLRAKIAAAGDEA